MVPRLKPSLGTEDPAVQRGEPPVPTRDAVRRSGYAVPAGFEKREVRRRARSKTRAETNSSATEIERAASSTAGTLARGNRNRARHGYRSVTGAIDDGVRDCVRADHRSIDGVVYLDFGREVAVDRVRRGRPGISCKATQPSARPTLDRATEWSARPCRLSRNYRRRRCRTRRDPPHRRRRCRRDHRR